MLGLGQAELSVPLGLSPSVPGLGRVVGTLLAPQGTSQPRMALPCRGGHAGHCWVFWGALCSVCILTPALFKPRPRYKGVQSSCPDIPLILWHDSQEKLNTFR